jgi:hypothetical protein
MAAPARHAGCAALPASTRRAGIRCNARDSPPGEHGGRFGIRAEDLVRAADLSVVLRGLKEVRA